MILCYKTCFLYFVSFANNHLLLNIFVQENEKKYFFVVIFYLTRRLIGNKDKTRVS